MVVLSFFWIVFRFVFLFNQLINPFGYCGNKLLKFLSDEQYHQPHKNKTLFLNKWFRSLTNDTNRMKHVNRSYDMKSCHSDSSETELLEKDIDKFLANQKLTDNNHVSVVIWYLYYYGIILYCLFGLKNLYSEFRF